jgi:organic radical activating enzyme
MLNKDIDNLHIIVYLSYKCNLRCSYCVINFNDYEISFENIDHIINFISINKNNFLNIFIEFIWWEPLIQLDCISYFLSKIKLPNIKFQLTTNWTIITQHIYESIIKNIDIVNLSYNENYFYNKELFSKISDILLDKSNININFIYNPRNNISTIKEHFLFILNKWYRNINILPIVLVHDYTNNDFLNLLNFINYCEIIWNNINLNFIYYIQEKNNHFEITIDPHWNVLWDNMWTAEDFFWVKSKKNISIWKISDLSFDQIYNKLENYSYIDYLKNIIENWDSKQSYKNLLFLSNLLKKYDKRKI